MDAPQTFDEIETNLPDRLKGKICPFRPPLNIPVPNSLDPKQVDIRVQPWPCMGHACAIWDSCQGDNSPRTIKEQIITFAKETRDELKAFYKEKLAPLFEKLAKSRLLGGLFG